MHRTKRAARNLAWQDKNNPFAKRWAHRVVSNPQSEAENGDGLFRLNTDDPSDYRNEIPDGQDGEVNEKPRPRPRKDAAATAPEARSRQRQTEPGDEVDIPTASSPTVESKRYPIQEPVHSEKQPEMVNGKGNARSDSETLNPETNEKEEKQHGWKKIFHKSKGKDKSKGDDDDNNGKSKKKQEPHFTPMSQLKATLFNSWINVLLIASPVGIAIYYANVDPVVVFVVNFIAIIPLAAMLSYATEEIALRTGEVIGGLLNASFGNAVELIVSIIALAKNQILIVQTSLIGSMLSNLLLVMGMCFFAGGVNRVEQAFNLTVAQTAASLLFLAVSSLLIPTAFNEWANTGTTDKTTSGGPIVPGVVSLSRGTAILLLIVYGCYLFFQLKSHAKMYNATGEKNEKRDFSKQKDKMKHMIPGKIRRRSLENASRQSDNTSDNGENNEKAEDEEEVPQLSIWVAVATLAASTVLVALNAEYLVDSINAITCGGGISKNFVGLILLPIVGNAAEHATALTVAIKDKMDLAIGVAVGSSMQIALLVLPFVVVLGWIIGDDDMTLYFDGFQIAVLFVAVLLVNYLIQDGKSHWLEGVLLMVLYIIIAVAAWFYPTAPGLSDCPS